MDSIAVSQVSAIRITTYFGTVRGGAAVVLPDRVIPPDDPRFEVGRHTVELSINDGTNPPVSTSVTVKVVKRPRAGGGR